MHVRCRSLLALLLTAVICPALYGQENLALLGIAAQSSDFGGGQFPASIGNDGDLGNFTATATAQGPAIWEVDLTDDYDIGLIIVHNRDNCCPARLRDIVVSIHENSFLDDEALEEPLDPAAPAEDFVPLWDSALWESEVLNPENELGGGNVQSGPDLLAIDLIELTGGSVVGQYVRVTRIPDRDLSGTGGAGNADEPDVLSLGEVEVFEAPSCPEEGDAEFQDSRCTGVEVLPPEEGDRGVYVVTAQGEDDGGDPLQYTFRAELDGEAVLTSGPGPDPTASFNLMAFGTWVISVTVDDNLLCADSAPEATCSSEPIEIVPPGTVLPLGDKTVTQSSDFGSFVAALAVDGNYGNFTATASAQAPAIWEVDLGEPLPIQSVIAHNRGDGCCQSRLRDILISVHEFSFVEDEDLEAEVTEAISPEDVVPLWDSALWESDILNLENELGGGTTDGPPLVQADPLVDGQPVVGQFVRITRIPDRDLSGTGGAGNPDEPDLLSMGEVEVFLGEASAGGDRFRRGDVDGNGALEVTDPINNLSYQFLGDFAPPCLDALDWDDNGAIEVTDPIGNLTRQFLGGDPAPEPGSESCGTDATEDALGCDMPPVCE